MFQTDVDFGNDDNLSDDYNDDNAMVDGDDDKDYCGEKNCGRNILLIMDLDAPDWHYFQAPGTFIPPLHFSNQTMFPKEK